jgi:hypothetical protein
MNTYYINLETNEYLVKDDEHNLYKFTLGNETAFVPSPERVDLATNFDYTNCSLENFISIEFGDLDLIDEANRLAKKLRLKEAERIKAERDAKILDISSSWEKKGAISKGTYAMVAALVKGEGPVNLCDYESSSVNGYDVMAMMEAIL